MSEPYGECVVRVHQTTRRVVHPPIAPRRSGHSFVCSQRPSCVGLTTPGMWAPLVISSRDTSAYLRLGSGSSGASAVTGAGPPRLGSMRRPRSVPRVRNSWARWPARSLLPLPPRAGARDRAGFTGSALAGPGASPCARSSRSLRLPRATRAASSFSLSDISTAQIHHAPRQRRAPRVVVEKREETALSYCGWAGEAKKRSQLKERVQMASQTKEKENK
jgi:hypothetical protein